MNQSESKATAAAAVQETHFPLAPDRYHGNEWCSHVSLSVHPPSAKVAAKARKHFCNSCGKRIAKSDPKLSVVRKVLAPRFPVEKALFYHLTDRCARDPVTMTMKYGIVFPIPDQIKGYNNLSSEIKQQLTQLIAGYSFLYQNDSDTQTLKPPTNPNDTSHERPLKYQAVEDNSEPSLTINPNNICDNNNNNNNNDSNSQHPTGSACLRRRLPKANADSDYQPSAAKNTRTSDKQRFTAACRLAVAPQINAFRTANIDSVCSFSPAAKVRCEVSGEMISANAAHVDHAAPNTFQVLVDRFLQKESQDRQATVGKLLKRTAYVYGHFFDLRLRDEFAAFHQSQAHLQVVKSAINQGMLKRKLESIAITAAESTDSAATCALPMQ